jgi:hypothetical protein
MKQLLTLFLALGALNLPAQSPVRLETPTVKTSGCPTNTFLLTTNVATLLSLQAFNHTSSDLYLMVCVTNNTPAANWRSVIPAQVVFAGLGATLTWPAGRGVGLGSNATGKIYICASTTPATFTNLNDAISIEATYYGKAN